MRWFISAVMFLSLIPSVLCAGLFDSGDKKDQIEFFMDLGILKHGKADASGTREILILSKDGTGAFTHQHLTADEGTDFQTILTNRGLVEVKVKPDGNKEKHLLVHNPKDVHTNEWIPFSRLKEVREQIRATGKTVLPEPGTKRTTENDLNKFNFSLGE